MNPHFLDQLTTADHHLDFLRLYIQELEKLRGRGVRAALCRKAGFASRSYLTELLTGKKGLSLDAIRRIKDALQVPSPHRRLFELLALRSNPELNPKLTSDSVSKKITSLRDEISASAGGPELKPDFNFPEVFQVYAGLGPVETGANLGEIKQRVLLPERKLLAHLGFMRDKGWISVRGDRYFAKLSAVDKFGSGRPEDVANMTRKVTRAIYRNSDHQARDQKGLNFYSAFSMRKKDLPQLKKEIQTAVLRILDEFQVDDGDCVEQLYVCLFRNPLDD